MPESQLRLACLAVESSTGTNIFSICSIVVAGNGTVIYYDQWEDGYEVNLASPAQSTTQIWGDGINSNGIAPGFTNDPVGLPSGAFTAGETGITSVPIDVIQDLNTNGLVDAGEPLAQSTLTAGDGTYSLAGVIPGNYVIQETDLASYSSTGDLRPPNDNQISLRAMSGAVTNGNDFFDIFVGAPYTNRPPVAINDAASAPVNVSVTVPVLSNDLDPDGNPLELGEREHHERHGEPQRHHAAVQSVSGQLQRPRFCHQRSARFFHDDNSERDGFRAR